MDRFYLARYQNEPGREPAFQDLGSVLRIAGTVFQGAGSTLILLSPSGELFDLRNTEIAHPSVEEWSEIIRQTDIPEIFVGEVGGINKVLHRKQRYEISGAVQQKIWARDGFKCMFCMRMMGDVQLTIDHWIPLEKGGANDTSNFLSACRACNKKKGMMMPEDFCRQQGFNYDDLTHYMSQLV